MVSSLTQADVARLLTEPSASARAEVADKLAREIDSSLLTEAELQIAHDIIRAMAKDVELAVRRALSQSLRGAKHLPHDVALRLANDVEAVALPILANSPVVTDTDLLELIRHGSAQKQETIAGRAGVSRTGRRRFGHPGQRNRRCGADGQRPGPDCSGEPGNRA